MSRSTLLSNLLRQHRRGGARRRLRLELSRKLVAATLVPILLNLAGVDHHVLRGGRLVDIAESTSSALFTRPARSVPSEHHRLLELEVDLCQPSPCLRVRRAHQTHPR